MFTALAAQGQGSWEQTRPALTNFDKRIDLRHGTTGLSLEQQSAAVLLRSRVPEAKIEVDPILGTPKWVTASHGFLSGSAGKGGGISPQTAASFAVQDRHRATKAFLKDHAALFGHGPEVLADARIKREFVTEHNGLKTVVWEQQLDQIAVFEGLLVSHTTKNDEIVSLSSRFVPNPVRAAGGNILDRAALLAAPPVSAAQAIAQAAQNLGETLPAREVVAVEARPLGQEQRQRFKAAPLKGLAEARLVWLPMNKTWMRLCWEVLLTTRGRGEMFRVVIDAQTGEATVRHCLTDHISDATYRVFIGDSPTPLSPGYATPVTNQPPLVERVLVVTNAANTNASPNGWINDGDNETRGNNVDAHTDHDDDNLPDLPRPQGSPFRVFDFPLDLGQNPTNSGSAAVVQLFYWANWMHDKLYELGFTEAAGNFQMDNFGRGGLDNDPLLADAQDGGSFDDSNMSTPPDGISPRMQIYLFSGPDRHRDGDLDAELILHEYTHGLSHRRVGGGAGVGALQSGGMGEGWSDFYALSLLSEPGEAVNGVYAFGAYSAYRFHGLLQNYYFGIRRYPYCIDPAKNPLTFKDIDPGQALQHAGVPISPLASPFNPADAAEVHNQGELWCIVLREARANLIKRYGHAAGNHLALQLVTDGMNLSPPNPNFLQARDAIIQADQLDNAGSNYVQLWSAFAKRGLGASATSPDSSTTAGVQEAFDVPYFFLSVSLPASAREGDGILAGQGQVGVSAPLATNLTVNLASSDTTKVTAPATVVILAGETNTDFDLTIVDNSVLDGTQTATITASAPEVADGSGGISVADNETATLTLSLPASAREGDGIVQGTVSVSAAPVVDVQINLHSSDTTEIQVPSSVLMPSGQTSVVFNVTVVDDGELDGDQTATITAHVSNWMDGTAPMTVHDNESLDLLITLPAQAREGDGVLAGAGAVRIAGPMSTNLAVSLTSDDPTEATVPAAITILAGQTFANFDVTIVDDSEVDGTHVTTITASAAGFNNGSASIAVSDNESPPPPSEPYPPDLSSNIPTTVSLAWKSIDRVSELITNGGFETRDLTGWLQAPSPNGNFVIDDGTVDPPSPDGPLPPYAGHYSALAEHVGPGVHSLYQDVAIPVGAASARLSWAHRLRNFYPGWTSFQQFTVEIQDTNGSALAVAFVTKPGDPLLGNWVTNSFDLTAFIGQTVRLACIVKPGGFHLDVHLDNVSVLAGFTAPGTFDVYFGSNTNPGPAELQGSTTNTSWDLPRLAPLTTYYWQIVGRRFQTTPGPVWRFTTRGVDHFEWSVIPSPQMVNQPFNALVTAKDEFNVTVSNFTGTVSLSGSQPGAFRSNKLLTDDLPDSFGSIGNLTLGYSFTPNTNLLVTHVRHFCGAKVSIWTDGGVLLASQLVSSIPGAWVETQLPTPLFLQAGSTYRVAFHSANETFYWNNNQPPDFPDGQINQSYEVVGDAFPTNQDSVRWWAVDLRYQVGLSIPLALSPVSSASFTNGSWSGAITVLEPATNMVLLADDGDGHRGSSNPFSVLLHDDVGVSVTASPDPVALGENLTYSIVVTNIGPSTAVGVFVTNLLPSGAAFVSAATSQGACTNADGTNVICDLGTLPADSSALITVVVTAANLGTLTNQAYVSRAEADVFPDNNSASTLTSVQNVALSINDTSVTEGDSGLTNAIFTVQLSPITSNTVVVSYATANGTALAASDYLATNGSLVFMPGETTHIITVPVIGDILWEFDEAFLVNLSSPSNAVLGRSQGACTILNDDPFPTISITDASVVEGNVGVTNALFRVSVFPPSSKAVTLQYATRDGTAVAPGDYAAIPGRSLTFSPGQTNATIRVAVKGDTLIEPDETFFVVLINANNANIGNGQGLGIILNDDGLPGTVDHFAWDPIPSPQYVSLPFAVRLTALDAFNAPVTDFTNTVAFSGLAADRQPGNPMPLSPASSGNFSNGVWSGFMTVLTAGAAVQLSTDDGGGHISSGNTFDVFEAGDVSLSLSDSPDPVATNSPITYTLAVFNPGPWPATGVSLSNLLPAGVSFISATSSQGACTRAGNVIICDLDTLPAASNATVRIVVASPSVLGDIVNRATVTATEVDPNLTNNSATVITTVVDFPPTVIITSPTNGAAFRFPTNIPIAAAASDIDGFVTKVEFFANGVKAGEATNSPFTFNWTNATPGNWLLTAKATDNGGKTATSDPVNLTVLPPAPGEGVGLFAEYFNNMDFSGLRVTQIDPLIFFDEDFGNFPPLGIASDTFSARWSGAVQPLYSDTYTFYTYSDDGVRLFVDGQLLIDHFTNHPPVEDQGTMALKAGQFYSIRIEYYQDHDGGTAWLSWSSTNQFKEIIPSTQLYPLPVIMTNPSSQTLLSGTNLTLAVFALGELPLTYQWRSNGVDIPDANSMIVLLTNLQPSSSGGYSVVVSNTYGAVTSTVATLTVIWRDTDGDGMPDAWELAHGLDPSDPADAGTDPDHDGLTNLQEYIAGTDPHDPLSVLIVRLLDAGNGGALIRFSAMPNISYTLQYRTNLVQGQWNKLTNVAAQPGTNAVEILDPAAAASGRRYYRIATPQQP